MPLAISLLTAFLFLLIPSKWGEKSSSKLYKRLKRWNDSRHCPKKGQDLAWLVFSLSGQNLTRGQKLNLPKYKFYTTLTLELLQSAREQGTPIEGPLKRLREHLLADVRFERLSKREGGQALAQFFLVSAVSFALVFSAQAAMEQKVSGLVLSLMLTSHGLGLLLYQSALFFFKRKRLKPLEEILRSLIILESTLPINMPSSMMLARSGITAHMSAENLKKSAQAPLLERLKLVLGQWLEKGRPLSQTLGPLMDELEFLIEWAHQGLLKEQAVYKFLFLTLFYLMPYLAYILSFCASLLTLS